METRFRDAPAPVNLTIFAVCAMVLSGNSKRVGLPIGPDRLLIAAAILLLLLDRQLWRGVRLRFRPVHAFLLGLLAIAFFSASAHGTLTTEDGFFALLDKLGIVPFVLFVFAPVLFRAPSHRDLLVKALVVLGLYLSLTAVFERIGPTSLVFPRYIMNPNIGTHQDRARGPFLEAVPEGLALTLCAGVAVIGLLAWSGWWRRLAIACIPLCGLAILLTLTRAIWIGAALGVLAAMLTDSRLRRWIPQAIGIGTVGVLIAFLTVPGLSSSASSRSQSQLPIYDRLMTDAAAVRIIDAHPLTGIGWLKFIDVERDWLRQSDSYPLTDAKIEVHNVALSIATELGLPALALWAGALATGPVLGGLRRQRDRDLQQWQLLSIVVTVSWFTAAMFGPVPQALPNATVWLLGGIALGGSMLREVPTTTNRSASAPVGVTA